MSAWLSAFLFTQLVEVPVYGWGIRSGGAQGALSTVGIAFGASLMTHPAIWHLLPWQGPWPYVSVLITAEGLAIGVEALWLRACKVPRALPLSLVANGLSAGLGLASRSWLGWP